jgi:hypothetical protein
MGQAGGAIYEVETDAPPFRTDMSCLTMQGSILVVTRAAMRYWSGQTRLTDLPRRAASGGVLGTAAVAAPSRTAEDLRPAGASADPRFPVNAPSGLSRSP